ncbi:MAG: addiction module protein [Opitutaceae bacterium]|nr:addiction module protein [Opitutaceae bacterium]
MNAAIAKEVAVLSPDQRIELIGEIWNTLAATPETVPVPESHRVELARRVEAHRAAPDELIPWEQVEAQIDEQLRKRP